MTMQCIGTCSIYGGRVLAYMGPWYSVLPPPPASCESCNAVQASHGKVIDMVPRRYTIGTTSEPSIYADTLDSLLSAHGSKPDQETGSSNENACISLVPEESAHSQPSGNPGELE